MQTQQAQHDFLSAFAVDGTMGHYRIGHPETGQWITSSTIPDFPPDTDCYFTPARLDKPFNNRSSFVCSNYAWVDYDKLAKPRLIIRPSWVVSSGTGRHIYYKLQTTVTAVEVEELNKILIELTDGDTALFPCTTILRVPYTTNTKYTPSKPVTILERSSITYSPEFIRQLGQLNKKTIHKIITGDSRGYQSRSERDWAVIGDLISVGMSYEDAYMIYEYNKIGEKLSEDGGDKYFKRTYNELQSRLKSTKTKLANGTAQVGFYADEENKCYKWGNNVLSTFIAKLVCVINMPDNEVLLKLNITTKRETTEVVMPRRAFNNVREFDNYNKILDANWFGSDTRLRQFLSTLTEGDYQVVNGVHQTGLHRNRVGEWKHIFTPTESTNDTVLLQRHYGMPIIPDTVLDEDTLKKQLLNLLAINRPEVMWTVLAWYIGALAKPYFESLKYRYPILQITGTTGTGKTTTVHALQRLFSIEPTTYDANTTNFVMLSLFGSTNAIPVAVSEHRSAENLKDFVRLVLLSYDSGHNARGKIDKTVEDYPLTAPLCVDGEDTFSDAAAIQRTVVAVFRNAGRNTEALRELRDNGGALRLLSNVVLRWIDSGELLSRIESYCNRIKSSGIVSDRPIRNHAVLAAVGSMLADYLGVDMPVFWNESLQVVVPHGRPRLLVDDFMTDVINSIPTEQARFTFAIYNNHQLAFQMSTAHNWWMSRQRTRGGTVLDIDAIRRQLLERPYFISMVKYKGAICYLVDTEKAVEYGLEVSKNLEEI